MRPLIPLARDRATLLAIDLESVLVPEIWCAVASQYSIPALAKTTRQVSDYRILMQERIILCRQANLRFSDLRAVVANLSPLPGALDLLRRVRARLPLIVLSDTFQELAAPLLAKLENPLLLGHQLVIDEQGYISEIKLRGTDAKRDAVIAFKKLGYYVVAVGDSYNDLGMINAADYALLINPPLSLADNIFSHPVVSSLKEVEKQLGL